MQNYQTRSKWEIREVNLLASDVENKTPNAIDKGPPNSRNFSLGAQRTIADRPPTIPKVLIRYKNIYIYSF